MSNTEIEEGREISPSVGMELRRLRKSRRMSIAELAAATGRSSGYLSQVERGFSDISILDLQRITHALGVPLSWFFVNTAQPDERGHIVRAGSRRQVGSRETGLTEELLSPDIGGRFEMFQSVFEPGATMERVQRRATEEAGYVVSGEFELSLEGRKFHLNAGDAFRINGEYYSWRNPGSERTVIVWVISPPIY